MPLNLVVPVCQPSSGSVSRTTTEGHWSRPPRPAIGGRWSMKTSRQAQSSISRPRSSSQPSRHVLAFLSCSRHSLTPASFVPGPGGPMVEGSRGPFPETEREVAGKECGSGAASSTTEREICRARAGELGCHFIARAVRLSSIGSRIQESIPVRAGFGYRPAGPASRLLLPPQNIIRRRCQRTFANAKSLDRGVSLASKIRSKTASDIFTLNPADRCV